MDYKNKNCKMIQLALAFVPEANVLTSFAELQH